MKGTLRKISSSHNRVRTNTITGDFNALPVVGRDFEMTAPPLDPAASIRWLRTTPVQVLEQIGKEYDFHTLNSHYRLTVE